MQKKSTAGHPGNFQLLLKDAMRPHDDQSGDWQGLGSTAQSLRYAVIARMLRSYGADTKVLDVGCGEAVLRAWLPRESGYTGIEPSAAAVRIARERNPGADIVHDRAESFESGNKDFDSIVFNEMLYYAADPVGLLRKYAPLLRPGGVILCSIFPKADGLSLKRRVACWLAPRRPRSNAHCEQMVRTFMAREAWPILDDRSVPIPGTPFHWHIWLATPRRSPVPA